MRRMFLISVAVSGALIAGDGAAIEADAVVLALAFNEGKGEVALDGSANGNDGGLTNEASWGDGVIGPCVKLANLAHVAVPASPSLSLANTDLSMAIWFNFSEAPGWVALLSHDVEEALDRMKWSWTYTSGKFRFHVDNTGGNLGWADSDFFEDPELDRWYHLAVVKAGHIYTYYLDGLPFGEDEMDEPIPDGMEPPLTIGSIKELWVFQGLIDEVLIMRKSLTQADVRRHMNEGVQSVLPVRALGLAATTWGDLRQ